MMMETPPVPAPDDPDPDGDNGDDEGATLDQ
jgi:hypothetical protein